MSDPRLFVSLFLYSQCKKWWPDVKAGIARELDQGEDSTIPAFRTLYRLRKRFEVHFVPEGSTLISKARCLVAGKFARTDLPLWVSIDDDVDASDDALRVLVDGAREGDPRIVYGAMKTRTNDKYNVGMVGADETKGGEVSIELGKLFPVTYGGAALMAVRRDALELMCDMFHTMDFVEKDEAGVEYINPGLFMEAVLPTKERLGRGVVEPSAADVKRVWVGEDVMFSRRALIAGVERWGFIHPGIVHAGIPSVTDEMRAAFDDGQPALVR